MHLLSKKYCSLKMKKTNLNNELSKVIWIKANAVEMKGTGILLTNSDCKKKIKSRSIEEQKSPVTRLKIYILQSSHLDDKI